MREDGLRLRLPELQQLIAHALVLEGDDLRREQRRVHGAATPIASVPTGTPAGICAIDSSESIP